MTSTSSGGAARVHHRRTGAVDHENFRPVRDPAQPASAPALWIGRRPYILALSRLEPRKNFVRLIDAFAAASGGQVTAFLVIGGRKGWLYESIFARARTGLIRSGLISRLYRGRRPACPLQRCKAFAYPSLYEGFGLPLIEALACGTLVLTGNNSCLPEAGGPGAIYVQAEDVDSIAEGIIRLATDEALAATTGCRRAEHAAQFTWERSAQQLLSAYRKLL